MKASTLRSTARLLAAVFFLSAAYVYLACLVCPVHSHHVRPTVEPHFGTGHTVCHCISVIPALVPMGRTSSPELAFGDIGFRSETRLPALRIFKIYHPPLAS